MDRINLNLLKEFTACDWIWKAVVVSKSAEVDFSFQANLSETNFGHPEEGYNSLSLVHNNSEAEVRTTCI
jgi:hypothetical protein